MVFPLFIRDRLKAFCSLRDDDGQDDDCKENEYDDEKNCDEIDHKNDDLFVLQRPAHSVSGLRDNNDGDDDGVNIESDDENDVEDDEDNENYENDDKNDDLFVPSSYDLLKASAN